MFFFPCERDQRSMTWHCMPPYCRAIPRICSRKTMLGAIIGDVAGSIYEFNNYRAKDFEFIGRGADFTDDTVCTIAVADALLNKRDPAHVLATWCKRYPGRGYGSMFGQWIEAHERLPYNSFGN